jgi:hypothetical protein
MSKDMWDTGKKVHHDNQRKINVHYFFEELYTRRYVDGIPMANHIAAMLNIQHRITQAGETLPDLHVARAMILSLPKMPSWELIKIQLFGLDPTALTVDLVSTKLQAEANRRVHEKSSGETALYVPGKQKQGRGKDKLKEKGKGPQPNDLFRKCSGKGHWANKCLSGQSGEN